MEATQRGRWPMKKTAQPADGIQLYVLPLTKDEVFQFILSTWGRGAFRGFTKHVLPGEYDEWLAQLDKRLADCTDIVSLAD